MKEYGTKYNNHANIFKMFAEEKQYFASEICLQKLREDHRQK